MNKFNFNECEQLAVNSALNEVFEVYSTEEVAAVYLTGSRLNNLHTELSDVDLYVLLHQDKESLWLSKPVSRSTSGEFDFKVMEVGHFARLLMKMNPNLLEMLQFEPLYCSELFSELANFLFENRDNLLNMNRGRFFSGAYHLTNNNVRDLKNGKLSGKQGKAFVQGKKAYLQLLDASEGNVLFNSVYFTGDLKDELMEVKELPLLTEEQVRELEGLSLEMEKLNRESKEYEHDTKLKEEFVSLLYTV